jgi:hypothetical protein
LVLYKIKNLQKRKATKNKWLLSGGSLHVENGLYPPVVDMVIFLHLDDAIP